MNWYLKEIESEIDSEEELVNRKGMIEKVIQRLVDYVSGLLLQCTIFFFFLTFVFEKKNPFCSLYSRITS